MNILNNAFNGNKLEEILVANWAQFINGSKLLHFTLTTVQKNKNKLAVIETKQMRKKGTSISISRFQIINHGFFIWVDYFVPIDANKNAEGTLELFLKPDGNIHYNNLSGNIFAQNDSANLNYI